MLGIHNPEGPYVFVNVLRSQLLIFNQLIPAHEVILTLINGRRSAESCFMSVEYTLSFK